MDFDTSKMLSMISGHNRNETDMTAVSDETKSQIDNAIENIFVGKSILVWVNGGKLMDAWNTALDQLREELFCIPKISLVVEYLRIAIFNHRSNWHTKMLHSDERNSVAHFTNDTQKQELIDNAQTMILVGNKTIQNLIQSCGPDTKAPRKHQTKVLNQQHTKENHKEYTHTRQ